MSIMVIIALIAAVCWLTQQLRTLGLRVDALEDRIAASRSGMPDEAFIAPIREPYPTVASSPEPIESLETELRSDGEVDGEPVDAAATTGGPMPWAVEREDASSTPGLEELLGRKLPIWAGGLTLAIAGFLVVRYSIAAGLLAPGIRVLFAILFGGGLLTGAEVCRRGQIGVTDPRIPQALAGAGVASLYGAVLAAGNLYGLIEPSTAFAGLTIVTIMAGLLSLRFGAPSAVLGLIGGLAAPALVGSNAPHVPLLAAYLALTIGGLCTLSRDRGWWWLGAAALCGGFGWGLLLVLSATLHLADTLAVGALTLLLAAALPLVLVGDEVRFVRIGAGLAGCAQLAALIATGGFAMLDWGLFGLLAVATLWLSRRETTLAELPCAALAVGLALAVAWPSPAVGHLTIVLTAATLIFGGPAVLRLWRADARLSDAGQLAALALAIGLLPALHFGAHGPQAMLALLGAMLAAVPAGLGWARGVRDADTRLAILSVAAAQLLAAAAALGLPTWLVPPTIAVTAFGLLGVGRASGDARTEWASWLFLTTASLLVVTVESEARRLLGIFGSCSCGSSDAANWIGLVRWGVPAFACAGFATRGSRILSGVGQGVAVLLAFGAAAQVVPPFWLVLVPALLLAGLGASGRERLGAALATAATLSAFAAAFGLIAWLVMGGMAITGEPIVGVHWSDTEHWLLAIAALAIALGITAVRASLDERWRKVACLSAAVLGMVATHLVYTCLFAIRDAQDFIARGMAERTIWEVLLAIGALIAGKFGARRLAVGLGAAALAHFAIFSLLVYDPLWRAQQVGPWLVPAFGTALGLVFGSATLLPQWRTVRVWATMLLVVAFAFALLRQLANGQMLLGTGVTPAEDIARSVLAVALSIAFLGWGIRRHLREWRIGSLVLMLVAVAKVFLLDAAGLDGLARIASFAALGFSLIGIGWLYSRYLPESAGERS